MKPNPLGKILRLTAALFLATSFPSSPSLFVASSTAYAAGQHPPAAPSYQQSYQEGWSSSLAQGDYDIGYDGDFFDAAGSASYYVGVQAQGSGQFSLGHQGVNLGLQANALAGAQTTASFHSVLQLGLVDVETTVTGSFTTGYNASFNASFQLSGNGLTFSQGSSVALGSGGGYQVTTTVKPGSWLTALGEALGSAGSWAIDQLGNIYDWATEGSTGIQIPSFGSPSGGSSWTPPRPPSQSWYSSNSSGGSSYMPPLERPGMNPTTQVLPDPTPPPPPVPQGPQFSSAMMRDLPPGVIVGWTPETGIMHYNSATQTTLPGLPPELGGMSAMDAAKILYADQTGQWGGGSAPGGGGKGPVGGGGGGTGAGGGKGGAGGSGGTGAGGGTGGGTAGGGGGTQGPPVPSEPSEPSEPSGPSEPAGGDEGMEVVEVEAMEPTSGADWNFAPEPEAVTNAYSNLTFIGSEYSNAMNEIYSRAEEFLPHEGIVFDASLGKTFYKVGGEMLDSFDYTVKALEKGMSEAASRAAGKVAIAQTNIEVAERNLKTQQAELERVKTENPERIGEIQDNIAHYEGMLQEEKAKHSEAMSEVRTFETALDDYVRTNGPGYESYEDYKKGKPGQAEEPAKGPAKEKSEKDEKKTSQATTPSPDFHLIPGREGVVHSTFLDAGTSADIQPSQGPGLDSNLMPEGWLRMRLDVELTDKVSHVLTLKEKYTSPGQPALQESNSQLLSKFNLNPSTDDYIAPTSGSHLDPIVVPPTALPPDPSSPPQKSPLQFDGLLGKQFRNSSAAPGVLQNTSFSQGAAASSTSSSSAAPCPDSH